MWVCAVQATQGGLSVWSSDIGGMAWWSIHPPSHPNAASAVSSFSLSLSPPITMQCSAAQCPLSLSQCSGAVLFFSHLVVGERARDDVARGAEAREQEDDQRVAHQGHLRWRSVGREAWKRKMKKKRKKEEGVVVSMRVGGRALGRKKGDGHKLKRGGGRTCMRGLRLRRPPRKVRRELSTVSAAAAMNVAANHVWSGVKPVCLFGGRERV